MNELVCNVLLKFFKSEIVQGKEGTRLPSKVLSLRVKWRKLSAIERNGHWSGKVIIDSKEQSYYVDSGIVSL